MPSQTTDIKNPAEDFQRWVTTELEHTRKSLNELQNTFEQSQADLNKLAARSAAITGHLQQVQAQLESLPRNEIRTAYQNAMETQQRLLVMRGQLEKLQSDQSSLQKYVSLLERTQVLLSEGSLGAAEGRSQGSKILEMMINAQETERQRLSRQMHDGPAQALSNFIVQTEIATRLFDIDPAKAKEELMNLKSAALSTFQKVRVFIFELRPMMLDDLGLFPTIRRYVDAFKEQTGVDVNLNLKGADKRFEPYIEVMIFRALQELMGNAYRHNQDTANKIQITINVAPEDNLIKVAVHDNGKGFNPSILEESGGMGIKLIKERVELLGGYFEINSAAGQGCRATFQVPCVDIDKVIK